MLLVTMGTTSSRDDARPDDAEPAAVPAPERPIRDTRDIPGGGGPGGVEVSVVRAVWLGLSRRRKSNDTTTADAVDWASTWMDPAVDNELQSTIKMAAAAVVASHPTGQASVWIMELHLYVVLFSDEEWSAVVVVRVEPSPTEADSAPHRRTAFRVGKRIGLVVLAQAASVPPRARRPPAVEPPADEFAALGEEEAEPAAAPGTSDGVLAGFEGVARQAAARAGDDMSETVKSPDATLRAALERIQEVNAIARDTSASLDRQLEQLVERGDDSLVQQAGVFKRQAKRSRIGAIGAAVGSLFSSKKRPAAAPSAAAGGAGGPSTEDSSVIPTLSRDTDGEIASMIRARRAARKEERDEAAPSSAASEVEDADRARELAREKLREAAKGIQATSRLSTAGLTGGTVSPMFALSGGFTPKETTEGETERPAVESDDMESKVVAPHYDEFDLDAPDEENAVEDTHLYDDPTELVGREVRPTGDDSLQWEHIARPAPRGMAPDADEVASTRIPDTVEAETSLVRAASSLYERDTAAGTDSSGSAADEMTPSEEARWGRRTGILDELPTDTEWNEDAPEDDVLFSAYAPRAVERECWFQLAVWAYVRAQFHEMHERATEDGSTVRGRAKTGLRVKRGRIVTILLRLPTGVFDSTRDGTKAEFVWRGDIERAKFALRCLPGAAFGTHQCAATVVFGAAVAEVLFNINVVAAIDTSSSDASSEPLTRLDSEMKILKPSYSEIPFEDLEMKKPIGSGFAGQTWLADVSGGSLDRVRADLWRIGADGITGTGAPMVVVKTLHASASTSGNERLSRAMRHEAAVQSMVGFHPNVVSMVGACTTSESPALVLEYVSRGSLDSFLDEEVTDPRSGLSVANKANVALDVARGLLAVHDARAIHRDVAARNVLVARDWTVKLADFGLGAALADTELLEISGVQPMNIAAPECLSETPLFSPASDVYAYGCLLYELYAAKAPWSGYDNLAIQREVLGGGTLHRPESMPEDVASIMTACTAPKAASRPPLQHVYASLLRSPSRSESGR